MCVYLVQKFDVPVSEIKGHKDYSGMTVCPGKNLYRYLADGTIVRRVKKMIEEGSED
jgi:N-acetylmuramoyl-L-alanine amidase CwlA